MDPTTPNAQDELLDNIAQLLRDGFHSDVVVGCGESSFPAHKAILSIRSPVLAKACAKGIWKEGHDGILQLGNPSTTDDFDPSDDPVAVEMMLQFIYTADYLPDRSPYQVQTLGSHEKETPRSSICSVSNVQPYSTESHPDDIGSTVAEAPNGTSEPAYGNDQEARGEKEADHDQDAPADNLQGGLLKLHTRMHALGDKYSMPTLMDLAARKFQEDAEELEWDDSAFCEAIALAYHAPPPKHNKLNDVIVEILHQREIGLGISRAVESCIQAFPELAYGLYQRGRKTSQGPACDTCGTVEVRQCNSGVERSNVGFATSWDGHRCNSYFPTCRCTPNKLLCDSHAPGDYTGRSKVGKRSRKRGLRA